MAFFVMIDGFQFADIYSALIGVHEMHGQMHPN